MVPDLLADLTAEFARLEADIDHLMAQHKAQTAAAAPLNSAIAVSAAAGLPHKFVLDRFRARWRPLLSAEKHYEYVSHVVRHLGKVGGQDELMAAMQAAAAEVLLTTEAQRATVTVRAEFGASGDVVSSKRYDSAAEVKADLEAAGCLNKACFAAVDDWFPAYLAARAKMAEEAAAAARTAAAS